MGSVLASETLLWIEMFSECRYLCLRDLGRRKEDKRKKER
jgi:hypothetical protein